MSPHDSLSDTVVATPKKELTISSSCFLFFLVFFCGQTGSTTETTCSNGRNAVLYNSPLVYTVPLCHHFGLHFANRPANP